MPELPSGTVTFLFTDTEDGGGGGPGGAPRASAGGVRGPTVHG
jgi:hypothetical protein